MPYPQKLVAMLFFRMLIWSVGTESVNVEFVPLQITSWFYRVLELSAYGRDEVYSNGKVKQLT